MTLALCLSLVPFAAFAAGEAGWAADIPAMLAAGPYAEGEVIVAVDPAYADGFDLLTLMGLREDLEGEDLMTVPAEEASAGEAVLTLISRPDRTTEELLYALAGDDRVVFAEPNYRLETPEPASEEDLTAALGQAAEAVSTAGSVSLQGADGEEPADRLADVAVHEQIPDLKDFQWENKVIHTPGFEKQDKNENMEGDPIVVAVIDTPVDFSNPDLAPVAFTFTEEQQEALGCDVHGYNALSEDGKLELKGAHPHGSHCAGIIGAAWDGHGVSGVASNVQIVSCQCSIDGSFFNESALRCYAFIDRANEAGANIRITNNSWGACSSTLSVDAAVRALGERWGVVSAFAAGNSGRDWKDYGENNTTLAKNPYAILVAAVDPTEELAAFSDYNSDMVTLAAPGVNILSTVQPEEAWYIPDAIPENNTFNESFEEKDFRVTVVQEAPESEDADNEDSENPDNENQNNENQNNENTAPPVCYTVTTNQAMTGSHALELKLDQDKMASLKDDDRDEYCWLRLTLHDVGENPGRYVGLSFYSSNRVDIPQHKWPGGSEEDDAPPPFLEGRRYSDYHSWGTVWTDVPEGAVEDEELTITLGLVVKKGTADTVWFDSVGLGNEIVPYQYMSGTSMATPVTAGAAAVLAAQTGKTGSALVDHVKATVRQTDALRDKVATGGILDFAVSGATPPEREPVPARPLYDTRLPLDMSTGEDPFDYDAPGDWETNGPLVGVGDKLYYLPLMTDHNDYGVLLAFDPAARIWETLRPLPVPIYACSAAAFDGKLVVKGNTSYDPDEEETEAAVWVYDPADDSWSQASAEGVLVRQTLFAGEDGLLLAGSGKIIDLENEEFDPGALAAYDPETGAEPVRDLDYWYDNPKAAARDGAVYLFCADYYALVRITAPDGEEEDLTVALPDYRAMNLDPDEFYSYDEYTERDGVLLATDEGLLLVGVLSEDGAADTWLLRDGEDAFVPLQRKTCLTRSFFVAAEILQDKVYAIGTVWNEDAPRFFRANDLATLEEKREDAALNSLWAIEDTVIVTAVCPEDGAVLYCAAYGDTGQMTAVASVPAKSDGLFHAYTLTLDTSEYSDVKAFLLDSNARPLCQSAQSGP